MTYLKAGEQGEWVKEENRYQVGDIAYNDRHGQEDSRDYVEYKEKGGKEERLQDARQNG